MFSPVEFSRFGWMSNDLAIDLGTANTVLYVKGKGIVLREPSVVAVRKDSRGSRVLAVGKEAKEMLERAPATSSPSGPQGRRDRRFRGDRAVLRYFINKVHNRRTWCIPGSSSRYRPASPGVEKRACADGRIRRRPRGLLIEEPMAAAIAPTCRSPNPPPT